MQSFLQSIRGGYAMARWLLGAPFMAMRMGHFAKDSQEARELLKRGSERFLRRCRIRFEIQGDAPAKGTGCVLCYNESSFADVAALSTMLVGYIDRAGAAAQYGNIPFAKAACAKADILFISRGNRDATQGTMKEAVDHVKSSERLVWGGEGRLSGIDGVEHFKRGASLIAIAAKAPIVPVAFYGGHHTLRLGGLRARPGTIYARFGEPISTKGLNQDDARDLADRVRDAVLAMYQDMKAEYNYPD